MVVEVDVDTLIKKTIDSEVYKLLSSLNGEYEPIVRVGWNHPGKELHYQLQGGLESVEVVIKVDVIRLH